MSNLDRTELVKLIERETAVSIFSKLAEMEAAVWKLGLYPDLLQLASTYGLTPNDLTPQQTEGKK